MDEIYPLKNIGATDNINLKVYFEFYSKLFNEDHPKSSRNQNPRKPKEQLIKEEMFNLLGSGEGSEEFNLDLVQLDKDCDIEKLKCQDEGSPINLPDRLHRQSKVDLVYNVPKSVTNLEVLKCKEELENEVNIDSLLNYRRGTFKIPLISSNQTLLQDISPNSDFILTVLAYKPFQIFFESGTKSSQRMSFHFELEILGSNTLTEMIDKFTCPADKLIFKEVQNTQVDLYSLINSKEKYPSRFVFIDGVFYNDHRSPDAIDYSKVIIDWAKNKNIADFKSLSMEKIRVSDLSPKLGYPYIFVHQGNCEHLFVFSDARLIQSSDCLYSKMYPRLTASSKQSTTFCFLCSNEKPSWFCTECDRFPQEKVLLCTDCCNSYNFQDGEKIGNFKLYPYYNE